jgi:DNA-binding response OmpR family regulator
VSTPQSVLIVDASDDAREVLSTALSRRGLRTLGARGFRQGTQIAQSSKPDLIVLDLEAEDVAALPGADESGSDGDRPSMVILGGTLRDRRRFPTGEFIPKPYHYAPLIRRIEELLNKGEE